MKVLVVVDMQNDFITGSLGTPEAQAIVPNVKKKIEEYLDNNDVVFYTRDTHFDGYLDSKEGQKLPVEHCIHGTNGWQIHKDLLGYDRTDHRNEYIIDKYTFGCWELPGMLNIFSDVDEIELVGLCTDICVVSNALLLKSYFYDDAEISVDATCCAGITPETHEAALKTMEMCQINVKR